jgi:hypothetical protein
MIRFGLVLFGCIVVLAIVIGLASILPQIPALAAFTGIVIFLVLFLFELWAHRFSKVPPLQESPNSTGSLRFPSRCLVITDLSYGGQPKMLTPVSESMDYRIRMRTDTVGPWVRWLVLQSKGRQRTAKPEQFTVSVDTGVLFFACCDALNRLRADMLAEKAMMDLVRSVEAGSERRFSILRLGDEAVGIVCIPSEGDGIYDVEVWRDGSECVEVKANFR